MTLQSPIDMLVTIYGGSGFIGRHVVRALARRGYRIRVAVRRPELAGHLQPLGRVGQIHAVQANLRHHHSVEAAGRDADVIINLVGILSESGRQGFDDLHTHGAGAVARVAAAQGARLIHVSALGAASESQSGYARSKADGEARVRALVPDAVILRPSVVFGPEDDFFNRFAAMARIAPVLPLIGGGVTRFQPVFVGDVAAAVTALADGGGRPGEVYELGGPAVRTMRELLDYVAQVTGRRRLMLPLPFPLATVAASLLQWLPGAPLTPDQVAMLRHDSVVSDAAAADGRTLQGLGVSPATLESVAPSYLWRFRRTGEFRAA